MRTIHTYQIIMVSVWLTKSVSNHFYYGVPAIIFSSAKWLEQINHKSTLISDFERGSWYVRNPKSEVILWEISNVLLKIEKVSKIYYSWSDLLLRQPAATSLLLATDNWLPLKTYVSANQCGDMLGGCNISLGIRWGNVFDMKIISYKRWVISVARWRYNKKKYLK